MLALLLLGSHSSRLTANILTYLSFRPASVLLWDLYVSLQASQDPGPLYGLFPAIDLVKKVPQRLSSCIGTLQWNIFHLVVLLSAAVNSSNLHSCLGSFLFFINIHTSCVAYQIASFIKITTFIIQHYPQLI